MLNAPHSEAGYNTIALQCQVPTGGWSITPQEVAGWDLTLSNHTAGALTAFTYTVRPRAHAPGGGRRMGPRVASHRPRRSQLNADAAFPNGFARAAQDTPINGLKSDFAAFIGISSPSGTCNFTCAHAAGVHATADGCTTPGRHARRRSLRPAGTL